MTLLEQLEAEEAAGWRTVSCPPPAYCETVWRLLTLIASVVLDDSHAHAQGSLTHRKRNAA